MQKKYSAKSNTLFMVKNLNKLDIAGTYFNIIKSIYDKVIAYPLIIFNDEKVKAFPLRSERKTNMPTLETYIQNGSGSPTQST